MGTVWEAIVEYVTKHPNSFFGAIGGVFAAIFGFFKLRASSNAERANLRDSRESEERKRIFDIVDEAHKKMHDYLKTELEWSRKQHQRCEEQNEQLTNKVQEVMVRLARLENGGQHD